MMCYSERIEQAVKDYQAGKDPDENFRLIDEYYRPRLISFFARRGFSADLREDLTQRVFTRVSKSMADFRGGDSVGAFSAWLFKIAKHIGWDHLRSQGPAGQTISLDGGGDEGENQALTLDPPDPSRTSNPLEVLLDQERRQRLKEAVMNLPKQQRNCLFWQLYHELSLKEIAVVMGISVETVKAHLHMGRAKLKADGYLIEP